MCDYIKIGITINYSVKIAVLIQSIIIFKTILGITTLQRSAAITLLGLAGFFRQFITIAKLFLSAGRVF